MQDEIDMPRILSDEGYRLALRHRMQTDLMWLAKYVLGYTLLSEKYHREAVEVFVHKDPTKPIREQSRVKRRMLILPRRTFKSTLAIADCVQWIINFPDIAIMVLTAGNSADSPLATTFVAEVASHFFCPEGAPRKALHLCFPEHRTIKFYPGSNKFITPARKKFRRDPTVHGVSIEQSLSGWHPDALKGEDVQDNRNSQTIASLNKVRRNFYLNLKMLGEGGYVDLTCTRYGPADLYGDMIQKAGDESIILWKPAYVRLPHAIGLEEDELTEQDVVLQFPEQLSWEFLQNERVLDPESFYTQYLNIAEGNFIPTFPIDRLEAAKIPKEESHTGKVHIAWRFEYGDSKYAAGAVGLEREGRMTIVEVQRGQFTPTMLARRVISVAKKWDTRRVSIEDTPGAQTMLPHLQNAALEASWRVEILWSEFLHDPTARLLAIKAAEPHLLAGRLLFADGIKNLAETIRQLYHFGMVEETDVAGVVARLAAQLPQSIAAENFSADDEEAFQAFIERDAYDRTYNRGAYYHAGQEPVPVIEPELESQDQENDYMPGLTG